MPEIQRRTRLPTNDVLKHTDTERSSGYRPTTWEIKQSYMEKVIAAIPKNAVEEC